MNFYGYVGGDPVNFIDRAELKRGSPTKPPNRLNGTDVAPGGAGAADVTDPGPGLLVSGQIFASAALNLAFSSNIGALNTTNERGATGPADVVDEVGITLVGDRGIPNLTSPPPPLAVLPFVFLPRSHVPIPRNRPHDDACGSAEHPWPPDSLLGTNIVGPCAVHDACYAS